VNFFGEHFAERSTKHGEVLAVDKHFASVDGSPTRNHTVGVWALFKAGSMRAVTSKQVEFVKAFGVEQGGNALACEQLALFVLSLY
jgi:hypothetical protein